jgi:cytochrome c
MASRPLLPKEPHHPIKGGSMQKHKVFVLALMAMFLFGASQLWAADGATAKEVKEKCQEAAKLLSEKGDAAFPEFNEKGKWDWKDSYVFVYDMDCKIVGHPLMPHLRNKSALGLKDAKGKLIGVDFLDIAKNPKGHGWTEYWWPKPNEKEPSLKIAYILKVPGKNMFVGAGFYGVKTAAEAAKQAGD